MRTSVVVLLAFVAGGCAAMHRNIVKQMRADGDPRADCYEACGPSGTICMQECDNKIPHGIGAMFARPSGGPQPGVALPASSSSPPPSSLPSLPDGTPDLATTTNALLAASRSSGGAGSPPQTSPSPSPSPEPFRPSPVSVPVTKTRTEPTRSSSPCGTCAPGQRCVTLLAGSKQCAPGGRCAVVEQTRSVCQ